MATDCNRLKTCKACNKRCSLIHSTEPSNFTVSSFSKSWMISARPFWRYLPYMQKQQIEPDECSYVIVEGPTGYHWDSILCFCGTSPSFKNGWESFVSYHSIQAGDIMVFRNMGKRLFVVQIFHSSGYEKQITHPKELVFPQQGGPDLCINQPQCLTLIEHPKKILRSDPENHFDQKGPLPLSSRAKHNACGKHNLRSIVKHRIDQPSTSDVRPNNPKEMRKFTKVMKKAAVTKSFWLTIPIDFGRKWLPQSKVGVVLICERKKWVVKYVGNRKELGIGSGWKEFVVGNQLKVGDTCTFELQNTKNMFLQSKSSEANMKVSSLFYKISS